MDKSPIIKRSRPVPEKSESKEDWRLPGCICDFYKQELTCTAHSEDGCNKGEVDSDSEFPPTPEKCYTATRRRPPSKAKRSHVQTTELESQSLLALHAAEEASYRTKELEPKSNKNDQEMESQSLLALHAAEEASYRTKELEPESNKNDQQIESQSQSLLALHKQEDYKKQELDAQSKRKMMIDGKFSWSLSLEMDNV